MPLVLFTTNLFWRFAVSVHRRLIRLWQKVGNKGQCENSPRETTPPHTRRIARGAQGHVRHPWKNDRVRRVICGDEHWFAVYSFWRAHELYSDSL